MTKGIPTEQRDWPVGRRLLLLLALVLLAKLFALFLRSWAQLELEENGQHRWIARNLSYFTVPPVLILVLYPLWRPRLAMLRWQWRLSAVSWTSVVVAIAIGVSLRVAYWGSLTAQAAFGSGNADPAAIGPDVAFACPPVGNMLLHLLVMACVVPLFEETINRGWIAEWLARYGTLVSVVVSALLFAVFHAPLTYPVAFVFGLFTAVIYLRTLSLWPGLIVHAVFNGLIMLDWYCLKVVWNPVDKNPVVLGVGSLGLLLAATSLLLAILLVFGLGHRARAR